MAGPERRFIDKVHRQIDPEWRLHKQSMTGGMSTNGTPDYYYEGYNWYIWIEYKYVETLPEVINLTDRSKKYSLSALQERWLNRATKNLTRAAVVLGSNEGALIFTNGTWTSPIARSWVEEYQRLVRPDRVALFAAGFDDHRVIEQYNQDAGVQHEHPGPSLHYRKPTAQG